MADIELVIKIPEKWFDDMVREEFKDVDELYAVIQHGTPLPKGHGKIVDLDELLKHAHTIGTSNYCEYNVVYVETIKEAKPILEADKEK